MIYATQNYDGDRIADNADIQAFDTVEQAHAWLMQPYGSEWDHSTAVIEPGRYGDCWVSVLSEPVIEGDQLIAGLCDFKPFSADQLRVNEPGSHPGGRRWWIEPTPDVLVVSYIRELEG